MSEPRNFGRDSVAVCHLLEECHEAPHVRDTFGCREGSDSFGVLGERFDRVTGDEESSPLNVFFAKDKLFRILEDLLILKFGRAS